MQQNEAWKLKLTRKRTRASGREASPGKHRGAPEAWDAERARRRVGGFAKSQTDTSWARQSALALADDGGRRAAPRLRRAAELGHRRHAPAGPRAARPSQRPSKHDFAPALLKPPGGTARPRGCPRGLSQDPGRPSPEFGVQGQPRLQDTRPISGGFSGKWRKPGTRPRRARPAHTRSRLPPAPNEGPVAPARPTFSNAPPRAGRPRTAKSPSFPSQEDLYRPRPDYLEAVQRDGMSPQWRPKIMAWFDQLGRLVPAQGRDAGHGHELFR